MSFHKPVIDIGPDLTIRIGRESARVTPALGLALAQSLAQVAGREMVRQAAERAQRSLPVARKPAVKR